MIEFRKIQSYTFIIALVGISVLCIWMLRSYIYPVFWAAVLAGLFSPFYKRCVKSFKGKTNLAAALTLIVIILTFLIPAALIISLIIQQALTLYKAFGNQAAFDTLNTAIQSLLDLPFINKWTATIDIQSTLMQGGKTLSTFVYKSLASSGQNTINGIIQFFIMLYTLFYFLRDGDTILRRLMYLMPLSDRYETAMSQRFISTARATLKGTLLIGVIQGFIGGLALLITDVPGWGVWALIMIILSIIPGVGAALVLVPTIVIMLIFGQFWQAVVVIIALVLASIVDNILRGPLVGKDVQMHPLLIFFATLGGLLSFGISGVVIGPVIVALFLSLWSMYEEKYKRQLEKPD